MLGTTRFGFEPAWLEAFALPQEEAGEPRRRLPCNRPCTQQANQARLRSVLERLLTPLLPDVRPDLRVFRLR